MLHEKEILLCISANIFLILVSSAICEDFGMITEKVHQHVFSAGFGGYIGLITVDGE